MHSNHYEIQRETGYCITNICSDGRYIPLMIQHGILKGFLSLFSITSEPSVIQLCLNFFLFLFEREKSIVLQFSQLQGFEVLQQKDLKNEPLLQKLFSYK